MPLRCALYLDFDNLFGGLMSLDPSAAYRVAEQPLVWLEQLGARHLNGGQRSWLLRRCYMNPEGSMVDPRSGKTIRFADFRSFFTRAGFEVIDCPSLTRQHKNAADIRMVLDAVDALNADTRYDEFVIASGDSDFTPLLQRLRAADRRTTVISAVAISVAYRAVADRYINEIEFVELLASESDKGGDDDSAADDRSRDVPFVNVTDGDSQTRPDGRTPSLNGPNEARDGVREISPPHVPEAFRNLVRKELGAATQPILLTDLAQRAQGLKKSASDGETWFGGNLSAAVRRLGLPNVVVIGHHVWDTTRHSPPATDSPELSQTRPVLPAPVAHCCDVVDLPRVSSEHWPQVFNALAVYAATHQFNLTESTRWSRDYTAQEGYEVGRHVFGYVIRGARYADCWLEADPPPDATVIGTAFCASLIERAQSAGLRFSDDDRQAIAEWLGVHADSRADVPSF